MEAVVLKALDFNLLAPTVHTFLQRYLRVSEVEQDHSGLTGLAGLVGSNLSRAKQRCSALAMVRPIIIMYDLYVSF